MCLTQLDAASCTGDSGGPVFYEFPSTYRSAGTSEEGFHEVEGGGRAGGHEAFDHWTDILSLPGSEDEVSASGESFPYGNFQFEAVRKHGSSDPILKHLRGGAR